MFDFLNDDLIRFGSSTYVSFDAVALETAADII
jgi:hypothetical protein